MKKIVVLAGMAVLSCTKPATTPQNSQVSGAPQSPGMALTFSDMNGANTDIVKIDGARCKQAQKITQTDSGFVITFDPTLGKIGSGKKLTCVVKTEIKGAKGVPIMAMAKGKGQATLAANASARAKVSFRPLNFFDQSNSVTLENQTTPKSVLEFGGQYQETAAEMQARGDQAIGFNFYVYLNVHKGTADAAAVSAQVEEVTVNFN